MISLYRLYPRIIEAYLNGKEMVILHTKGYDFSFMNSGAFKIFAQWDFAQPKGDTSKGGLSHLGVERC